MKLPYRVRIDQPSKLQPAYSLHGKIGIAIPMLDNSDKYVTVYFTEGSLVSIQLPANTMVRI